MAKIKGFNVDSVKNPRKQIDPDAAAAFVLGADYTAGAPVQPSDPEKKPAGENPVSEAQKPKKAKKERIAKEKSQKSKDKEVSVELPWVSGSAQLKRNILVQIDDITYKKLEYLVGHIGSRMSIRKFAIEAVQNRVEDELKKIL